MYRLSVILHLAATLTWLGHMFYWSLFSGPALKKIEPPETAALLRARSMRMGGLGWPALAVLVMTGTYMLIARGVDLGDLVTGQMLDHRFGRALTIKLVLVIGMVGYQIVLGHRRAPRAIYLNMLAALGVLAAAVVVSGR